MHVRVSSSLCPHPLVPYHAVAACLLDCHRGGVLQRSHQLRPESSSLPDALDRSLARTLLISYWKVWNYHSFFLRHLFYVTADVLGHLHPDRKLVNVLQGLSTDGTSEGHDYPAMTGARDFVSTSLVGEGATEIQ